MIDGFPTILCNRCDTFERLPITLVKAAVTAAVAVRVAVAVAVAEVAPMVR